MPTQLPSPVFGASRNGLIAQFPNAVFRGDNIIVLSLRGSDQGDPVEPVSLMIDNYNNGIPIAFTLGGLTDYVPAYTSEYINVAGMDNVTLSATSSVSINLTLYNTPQQGGRSRGLPPNGASDPMWSNVIGLWHFNANNGALIAVDSKNAGLYLSNPVQSVPLISTADSLFGGSSGLGGQAGVYANENFSETFLSGGISQDYTFEMACKFVTFIAGGFNALVSITENPGTANDSNITIGYVYDPTSDKFRFEVWRVSNVIAKPVVLTNLITTGFLYDSNAVRTWHQIALTTLGGIVLFVDGVQAGAGGTKQPLAGGIDLFAGGSFFNNSTAPKMYVDEMRITVGTRYTMNYTVATTEFPNQ